MDNCNNRLDIFEIINQILKNKILIIKITIISFFIGCIFILFSQKQYTSSMTFVPITSKSSVGGNLSGLAAIAGININNLSSENFISPKVYNNIVNNINFQKELIYSKYNFSISKKPISLFEYYSNESYNNETIFSLLKKYTIGLPSLIKTKKNFHPNLFMKSDSSINQISSIEYKVILALKNNYVLNFNEKNGYATIYGRMPEPIVSAQLTQNLFNILNKYLEQYKQRKALNDLIFIEKNYFEAKERFELKQSELAKFKDSNKNIISEASKISESKLNSESQLLFNVYNELAIQRERAKISLNETSPTLYVIEPVVVPITKSSPKKILSLTISIIVGLVGGIFIVLFKRIFGYIKDCLKFSVLSEKQQTDKC